MRRVKRPRRYVARHWLVLLAPVTRYSVSRDAYVLRGVGRRVGPVLRLDRRHPPAPDGVERRKRPFDGVERRRASPA
jgi:hypothetical protein